MPQEFNATPSTAQRRRRFKSRRESGPGAQISKFGAAVLMLMGLLLIIIGCIFAIRVFE